MKDNQFEFVRSKMIKMTMNQAKEFYKVHESWFLDNDRNDQILSIL